MVKNKFSFKKALLKLDRFGHSIGLIYKGESNFKTIFGSIVTLLTYTAIAINSVTIVGDYMYSGN